jgi:hypothetical protein
MKVALTGVTGFLGPSLVQGLLERGHTVHVLARDLGRAVGRLPPGVTGSFFDAATPLAPGALAGAEAVVHLAGEPVSQRWTDEAQKRIRSSRVVGTRLLVEAMRAAGTVRHFVSASAVGYYGSGSGAQPFTEESPPGEDFLALVCAAWEAEARDAASTGIRTVLLRLGVVLHPEGGALKQLLPPFRLGLGGRVGTGQQYLSWIHREDAVSLILFALEHPELQGPVNVTAPEPVTNADFTRALGTALKRPAVIPVPAFALKAALGEMSLVVLGGQRALPKRAQEAGFTFRHPELGEALRSLLG